MADTNNTELTRTDVTNICRQARDTFRGVIDASQYKNYILVMLFLKYISDVWYEHRETDIRPYDSNLDGGGAEQDERFILPDGYGFNDLHAARNEENIGELINNALGQVEAANKPKLSGVFKNIDFNTEQLGSTEDRSRLLKKFLEEFAKLDLRPSYVKKNVIGESFMQLIDRFGNDEGKKAGDLYTPASIRKLVAMLSEPEPGNLICDPTCGSGSLVLDTISLIEGGGGRLYGQEKNESTLALAKMNMFLNGIDNAVLECGDTISDPKLLEDGKLLRFDRVVANPPFSLNNWGAENAASDPYGRFDRGIPPNSRGDWAFILHMLATAKRKSGRVVVVVPHGVLFRSAAESRIREAVLKENLLDSVIGLPEQLFSSTAIPVALMVFDMRREKGGEMESRNDILFVDASHEFDRGRNQNHLTDGHIDKIFTAVAAREDIDKFAHVASFKGVEENAFNLNIQLYVDTYRKAEQNVFYTTLHEDEEIGIEARQDDIDHFDAEYENTRARLREHLEKLGI